MAEKMEVMAESLNDDVIVYKLKHALNWDTETITEFKFRKPSGDDILSIKKLPFAISPSNDTPELLMDVMMQYMARLSGEPISKFKRLSSGDVIQIGFSLLPFFMD